VEDEPDDKGSGGADGVVEPAQDIPKTRRQDALEPGADLAMRPSQLALLGAKPTFPDDDSFARTLRKIDNYIGIGEQVVLVSLLTIVILVAAGHAILNRAANIHLEFKDDVIRGGTFAIALLGGAFATHQSRHLAMDLISRRLSPRARLFLKVGLALFTMFMVVLLVRAGFHAITVEKTVPHADKLITPVRIAYLIPIGGGLIFLHTLIHTLIDVDYIARNKTPPERMRSAH
jgi:TRAP-type C4-dicarboxylate transport system permease small subunit